VILGAVDLTEIDFDKKEASVGVLIAVKEHRRKGYARESLEELSLEAINLGLDRLIATVQIDNIASQNLFQKCHYNTIAKSDDRYLNEGKYIETLLFEKWLRK
jgi:RimJ/RimL family protein N-acetyltransferase